MNNDAKKINARKKKAFSHVAFLKIDADCEAQTQTVMDADCEADCETDCE